MIVDEFLEVKINCKMYKFYESLGYVINKKGKTKIKISDLSSGSVYKINCKCDVCGKMTNLEYRQYLKNLKSHNFYSCKNCTHLKCELTNIEKYGCKMPLNNIDSEIYKKRKETMIENFGVEYLWQNNSKYQEVFITNYGKPNISMVDIIKIKKKNKSLEKYGTENVFQSDIIKEKIKKTNLEKYGFEYPSQSEDCRNKGKLTSISNFGVEHAMKNSIYFNQRQKRLFKKSEFSELNLVYQGSYELDFIRYCKNNNIMIENGPSLNYQLEDRTRTYHSDFYLLKYNLICEIKSQYTFDCDYEKNLAKKDYSIKSGYNFLFIIDKDYTELENIINQYENKQNS